MPISLRIFHSILIHTVKGFGIINNAEIDVFLELSFFFNDLEDVGNWISGSSAFSKTNLNIWKFTVHVLQIYLYIYQKLQCWIPTLHISQSCISGGLRR